MPIKYVLTPGYVTSESDGDRCFVSYAALMRLYRLNPAECVQGRDDPWTLNALRRQDLIWLGPQRDGAEYERIRVRLQDR